LPAPAGGNERVRAVFGNSAIQGPNEPTHLRRGRWCRL